MRIFAGGSTLARRIKFRVISTQDRMRYTRYASGTFHSSDALTNFMYTLMRDHLPVGTVEKLVLEIEQEQVKQPITYSNGWLARYANYLALRLTTGSPSDSDKLIQTLRDARILTGKV